MKKQGITLLALALAAAMGMFGCGKGAETGAGASLPGRGSPPGSWWRKPAGWPGTTPGGTMAGSAGRGGI